MENEDEASSSTEQSPTIAFARERSLPQVSFYSIEYPGYVQPSSVPLAIHNVGGQAKIDRVFKRTAQKPDVLLELSLRPDNPFAHPIPGDVVNANNLLLKVVKRKRKPRADGSPHPDGAIGEYKTEMVGIMSKTARFRSMVDYQYFPDPQDPVAKLRKAMDDMDVDALCSYSIPPEPSDETFPLPDAVRMDMDMNLDPQLRDISQMPDVSSSSNLPSSGNPRLFPPPLFSRQTIPQGYNFKANPASMISTTVDEETGEERKRMINRLRWKGYGPASILYADSNVPDRPPQVVEEGRSLVNEVVLKKMQEAFMERPVWTRMSLFNQFSATETRDIINSKVLLPLCCYVFQDGPWRDTLIRFSYDPRKDPSSRFFQRLYFRNANHPISRPSVVAQRQDRSTFIDQLRLQDNTDRKNAHIFDGQTIGKETAAFQLCDITDPMLKEMIEDPDAVRETCNERDGWYTTHAFEQIKTVLRHKFFSLLEGHLMTDDECRALLANEASIKAAITHNRKLRAGKHNMAKGALRPEDAAAMRLRATLNRSTIKPFQSQG